MAQILTSISSRNIFLYLNIQEIIIFSSLSLIFWCYFRTLWKFENLVGHFWDNIFVKICANFKPNPENVIAQGIFWILKIKFFRNDNFRAVQVVEENYVSCTLTFFRYYKKRSTSGKKIKCSLYKKNNNNNSSDLLSLYC